MPEVCFVSCYLQENIFQLAGGVQCSKAPDCCQRRVQLSYNGHLRKLKNYREVGLGSCWEIGTLSKMKCLSWTSPLMPSKTAYSILCSTFFMGNCFAALEGRNLSSSNIT